MVKEILARNNLQPRDLLFTLMVGGSTYIPFVRQRVGEALGTAVNCDIDPTTAVAVGAAYYAATKSVEKSEEQKATSSAARLQVKMSYEKASREADEIFAARITGDITGLSYRIIRQDGGYNSGLKPLTERIHEDLPLAAETFNLFSFIVHDNQGNVVVTDADDIAINSGYSISGQPLPEDICLEVDDEDNPGETRLFCAFTRMTPLPARRTIVRQLNKTVVKGSSDEIIHVKVLEGSQNNLSEANKNIGYLPITGRNISRDVQKGSDIEITLELSESRDLIVTVYLTMIDQEFRDVFSQKLRATNVSLVQKECTILQQKIAAEIQAAEERQDFEVAATLNKLRKEARALNSDASELTQGDVTDKKYQLEDRKRRLAQQLDEATRDKYLSELRAAYQEEKAECRSLAEEHGNDQEWKYFQDVEALEAGALSSGQRQRVQELIERLSNIRYGILWRLPVFLQGVFQNIERQAPRMNNLEQADFLIQEGRRVLQQQDWNALRSINHQLINLLPVGARQAVQTRKIGF